MASLEISHEKMRWPSRLAVFLLSTLAGVLVGGMLLLLWRTLAAAAAPAILGEKGAWYLSRSTGTVAYLLLSASTVWGLLLSSKIVKEAVPAAVALALHSALAWLAVALSGFHAFVLLFDGYYAYRLLDLLLPFAGPYRPVWVGLGIAGFYLVLLTSASFSWRKRLGHHWWRRLHLLTFVAYILVTVHGLAAGTDSDDPGMMLLYAASGLLVLFLTNYRLLAGR